MGQESIATPLVNTIKETEKAPVAQGRIFKPEEKRDCRCAGCGQFLFEILTDFAMVQTRCRRTECKLVNIVVIDHGKVSYDTKIKEPTVRY